MQTMIPTDPSLRLLARKAGAAIHEAFSDYHNEFKAITRRAQQRFERCEWAKWQADASERLDLREQVREIGVSRRRRDRLECCGEFRGPCAELVGGLLRSNEVALEL